jgi:uncharacterized protein (DUF2062 family)
MPRRLLKKLTPNPGKLQNRWYVRLFGSRIAHPALWSLQRRAVTGAFATGLAICFVPLPIHLPLAVLLAILLRLNLPTIVATVFLVNPLTVVPIYFTAYRVGAAALGLTTQRFRFKLDFGWLQYGLGPLWKPFLLGCLICGAVAAILGWTGLESIWRWRVRRRYRSRRGASAHSAG